MADIFISYAREDREAVEKLAVLLETAGLSCWWDRQLAAGAKYREQTEAELNAAKAVLVVWTKNSVGSHWVADEAAAAQEAGKLAPISLDGAAPPLGFRQFQVIDFSGWKGGPDGSVQDLVRALTAFAPHSEIKVAERALALPAFPSRRTAAFLAAGVAAVVLVLVGWTVLGRNDRGVALEPSIAVLPFANLTGDPEKDYIARGVAVEIIERLSRLEGVKAISRNSSFTFGADVDPRKVGEDLKVANVLSGTVHQEGGRILISAELADAKSGAAIWSQPFSHELAAGDPYAVQRLIAERVAGAMSIAFDVEARARPAGSGTQSLQAYDLYLQGLDQWWYKSNRQRASELFARAVELDANYADAWAGRAIATASTWGSLPPAEAQQQFDEAYKMVRRAVDLDPNLGFAQAVLGAISTTQKKWGDAEAATLQALKISRSEMALNNRQMLLLRTGRLNGAYAAMLELRQVDPLRGPDDMGLVPILSSVGRHDELREIMSRPDWSDATRDSTAVSRRFFVVMARINAGDPPASIRQGLETISERQERAPAEFASAVLAVFDNPAKARAVLSSWYEDQNFRHPIKWDLIPILAAWYGDTDLVLRVWQDELPVSTPRTAYIWGPAFSKARSRPEFKTLVQKIGLVDYWRAYGWADKCRPLGDSDFECG